MISVYDLKKKCICQMDISTEKVREEVFAGKATLYSKISSFRVSCTGADLKITSRDKDYYVDLFVKINNINRSIESFGSEDIDDVTVLFDNVNSAPICTTGTVLRKIDFMFNVKGSLRHKMVVLGEDISTIVISNAYTVNFLRQSRSLGRQVKQVLMKEFVSLDSNPDQIVYFDFVTNKFLDITNSDIDVIEEVKLCSDNYNKFIENLLNSSGYKCSEGYDRIQDFDMAEYFDTDLNPRKIITEDNQVLVKDSFIYDGATLTGKTSGISINCPLVGPYVSRRIMFWLYKGCIPCVSIIDICGMFGMYPVWYFHPENDKVMQGYAKLYVEFMNLIDKEDCWDTEEEVLDVWRYFVPFYTSDDWRYYQDKALEFKMNMCGIEYDELDRSLLTDDDFAKFYLIKKFTNLKPRHFGYVRDGVEVSNESIFVVGENPDVYYDLEKGTQINMFVICDVNTGEYFVKDIIRNKVIKVQDIVQLPLSRFYMMLIGLYAKYNLIFYKISPILYVCEMDDFVVTMSQTGCYSIDSECVNLGIPRGSTDDWSGFIQLNRYNPKTHHNLDYKQMYVGDGLTKLACRVLYRSEELDKFYEESDEDIRKFGTRQIMFDEEKGSVKVNSEQLMFDVLNYSYRRRLAAWMRMGPRGNDPNSPVVQTEEWSRILLLEDLGFEILTIEMEETAPTGNKFDVLPRVYRKDKSEAFRRIYEFYRVENVCLLRTNEVYYPWRITVGSLPNCYRDFKNFDKERRASNVYLNGGDKPFYAVKLRDEDILLRNDYSILFLDGGIKTLVLAVSLTDVCIYQNLVLDCIDKNVLNSIIRCELPTYRNKIFNSFQNTYFSKGKEHKVISKLFILNTTNLGYRGLLSDELIDIENGSRVFSDDADTILYYVADIIYPFYCSGEIEAVEAENGVLRVNGQEFHWSESNGVFTAHKTEASVDSDDESDESGKSNEVTNTNNLNNTNIFSE